jgi:2,3-bisphosphoglycerate-independent phosphoglycerate mutase
MTTPPTPHPWRRAPDGPVVVVVLDGVGIGDGGEGDAVARAHTPTLDRLRALRSYTTLRAHGLAVGLPSDEDMGNSEVGHNALGAGRVVAQGASLVARALADGRAFASAAWRDALTRVGASGEPLHLLGLLSDGNVHAHIDHLLALIEQAGRDGVARVRVHALLDGRDVPARSALGYVDRLEAALAAQRAAGRDYRVASGGGRMSITMDRYGADWPMVERGWRIHVDGEGRRFGSLRAAVETLYAESAAGDQDLPGFCIADADGPVGPIRAGAAVILYNFRGDRAVEICRAFEDETFDAFPRGPRPDVFFAGMMQYDGDLQIPARYLVDPPTIDATLGERLTLAGCRQLAIAETQKFGHVTYFWNGNRGTPFDAELERWIEIASDRRPFQERPWMKAAEVTDGLLAALDDGPWDLVRVNYANGDMVGHTGDLRATILAVEAVDLCLARLVEGVTRRGGVLVVTADHGNADQMLEGQGAGRRARTSHSLAPVPFVIVDPREPGEAPRLAAVAGAGLANVAATLLELLGFAAPADLQPSLLAAREPP